MSLAADTYGSSLLAPHRDRERLRRRARSAIRRWRSPTSPRARPTSCSCRASRTRSPNGTRPSSRDRVPGTARVDSSTAATCSGGGSAPRRRPSACGGAALMARVQRAHRRSRTRRPARAVGQDRDARARTRSRRVAPRAAPWSPLGPKITAILPLEATRARAPARAHARDVGPARLTAAAAFVAALTGVGSAVLLLAVLGARRLRRRSSWSANGGGSARSRRDRDGEVVLTHVHRAFARAVDEQYGR